MELSTEKRAKLNVLLFQLSELIKDPPTALDVQEWSGNIHDVLKDIRSISKEIDDELRDLVLEVIRRGEVHVADIDAEPPPDVIARSSDLYFEQVGYIISEINHLKSI